ncbi:MAG: toll/interleukin-1 receptor domain-containing protein [Sphingomonas sp.]|nr:toll/interleukin-1 receptor domain-containing protein [Sphingomonas sp.]
MARCTAPSRGHRTASGAADCPVHGGRFSRYGRGYNYESSSPPSYRAPSSYYSSASSGGRSSGGASSRNTKPRWSRASSPVFYSDAEVRALTPIRTSIENRPPSPDPRDVFLCHAWDDRSGPAKELYDELQSQGVTAWFSEKDVVLGTSLLREIDKGLAKSRVGVVLVTPAFLRRVQAEGIADRELSALLARDLLVPIVHNTTYEALRQVSPLLGSRSGLNTSEDSVREVAAKLAELVAV